MRPPTIIEEDGVLVIMLDDPDALNDGQAVGFRQPLYQAVMDRESPRVAVDLEGIDFLSSSGVALLIGLKRRVALKNGQLALFRLHPHVLDLFRVMKLASLFPIADDRASAMELLSSAPTL